MEVSGYLKIHQPHDIQFRPIVGGPTCPKSRLSNLIDIIIKPMVQYGGNNLRDSTEFLNKLSRRFPKETILTSFDITCLYTNIPHNLGMEAIQYWLTKYLPSTAGRFSQEFIVEGKKIILQNNTFTFNDRTFLQIKGTAL